MYEFRALKRLNTIHKNQIIELENACRSIDNIGSSASTGFKEEVRGLKCFYLTYKENKLVSYLRVYPMWDTSLENGGLESEEKNVEAAFLIHPLERGKECSEQTFDKAKADLKKEGINIVDFIHEPSNTYMVSVFNELKAIYNRSEYLMQLNVETCTDSEEASQLIIKEAELDDIEKIVPIYKELFGYTDDYIYFKLNETLNSEKLYIAYAKEELIGFTGIAKSDNCFCIFDFGIAVKHQKKGYGKSMLKSVIKILKNQPLIINNTQKIILHVTSKNQAAFNLYKNFGFLVKQQYNYYRFYL